MPHRCTYVSFQPNNRVRELLLLLTMLLAAQAIPESLSWPKENNETQLKHVAYVECYAKAAIDRRNGEGSPEERMKEAKEICRKEYDLALAAAVKDAGGPSASPSAIVNARAALDKTDARILLMLAPPPPAKLEHLPIRGMTGNWSLGSGPVAAPMYVRYSERGSLEGTLNTRSALSTAGLLSWEISSDENGRTELQAKFSDGRSEIYQKIPSFPDEMDFINPSSASVQRIDLKIEDDDLLIRCVQSGGNGVQLRFRRPVE